MTGHNEASGRTQGNGPYKCQTCGEFFLSRGLGALQQRKIIATHHNARPQVVWRHNKAWRPIARARKHTSGQQFLIWARVSPFVGEAH